VILYSLILFFSCFIHVLIFTFFKDGNTPLLIAMKMGHDAVVTTLLDKVVDVNATDKVNM
jgi:ankyrin repeat protein